MTRVPLATTVLLATLAVLGAGSILVTSMASPRRRLHAVTHPASTAPGSPSRTGTGKCPSPAVDDGATVALVLDLLAALATAGSPPARALAVVAAALGPGPDRDALGRAAATAQWGAPWSAVTATLPTRWRPVGDVLGFAAVTGAPAAGLLSEAADSQRRLRLQRGREGAARLGVMLVLPLGLCSLPAFVLLGIAPTVVSLLDGVGIQP